MSQRALLVWTALLLLPWLLVGSVWFVPEIRARLKQVERSPGPADEFTHVSRPGPWGHLQYSRIVIEPADEFTAGDYVTAESARWVFPGYSRAQLSALWHTAGLTAAQISRLENAATLEVLTDRVVVHPEDTLILELSRAARAKIYSALAQFPENPSQNQPFRFRADTADEWFAHSKLDPATIALVKQLLYQRGSSLLFSDHAVVLARLRTSAERVTLVRTLARKSTLLVKLRVSPETDLDALAAYWGRGPRRKGLRALLESLSHRPDGMTIDLAHLLPRFPRSHLFTYPQGREEEENHDCHWTALNFFNDPADDRFTNIAEVKRTLEQDYYRVSGAHQLGDILAFAGPDGSVVHSCVYVADDIVFTKNGAAAITPWILMSLSDVIAYYPADPPLTVLGYRHKEL